MDLGVRLGIGLTWNPWREPYENFKWNKETAEKLQQDVFGIKPTEECGLKKFKALTIGPYGHGKSSLINSFASLSVGEKTTVCNAAMKKHTTTHYRNFVFPDSTERLALCDISGLPLITDTQPYVENIKLILQGYIKSGYKLDKGRSISTEDEYYVSSPIRSDRVQCAMIVIDSRIAYEELPKNVVDGVKMIMEPINSMNIPVIAVLTKADQLSEHVKYSIESIFRCKKIQQAVLKTSIQLEIPAPKIYPVVTFEEMDHFTWKESIPLLIVLKSLLRMAQMHSHNADDVEV